MLIVDYLLSLIAGTSGDCWPCVHLQFTLMTTKCKLEVTILDNPETLNTLWTYDRRFIFWEILLLLMKVTFTIYFLDHQTPHDSTHYHCTVNTRLSRGDTIVTKLCPTCHFQFRSILTYLMMEFDFFFFTVLFIDIFFNF